MSNDREPTEGSGPNQPGPDETTQFPPIQPEQLNEDPATGAPLSATSPETRTPQVYGSASGTAGSSRKSGNTAVIVIVLALLVLVGVLGAWFLTASGILSSNSSDNAAPAPTTSEEAPAVVTETEEEQAPASETSESEAPPETTSESPSETSAEPLPANRPAEPDLPPGAIAANDAARGGEPAGNLNNVHRGSEATSEQFAQAVRDEYVRNYLDTGELNAVITARSPVTGQSYQLTCTDSGDYVTCTGGNNAEVFIS